jgi:hypothetical protein
MMDAQDEGELVIKHPQRKPYGDKGATYEREAPDRWLARVLTQNLI